MTTIKKTISMFAVWNEYGKNWSYAITDSGPDIMAAHGWVHVESKVVEFDRPTDGADWSAGAIELTRKEQERIRAEAQAKCNLLDERINSLLAIECKVSA